MIDVKLPADKNVSLKDLQKLFKYKNLQNVDLEVTKIWKLKTKAIPVVT